MAKSNFEDKEKKCSFCGKLEESVEIIIAGPGVYICDECTELCRQIVATNIGNQLDSEAMKDLPTPSIIKKHLDDYVIGQDDAKKYLATAVYNHYKRVLSKQVNSGVNVQKSNILLIGPTGSGKTLLVESLAKFLKVPFASTDAVGLTEAGYSGDDITNILTKLYQSADGDLEKVEQGIVYIDEIDKKRKQYGVANRDVSGEGVQNALLRMIEGSSFDISVSNPREKALDKKVTVNTRNILFICGGAFVGLDKLVKKRTASKVMGLSSKHILSDADTALESDALLANVETQDLTSFGLIPEFLGRLPIVAVLQSLKKADLVNILTEPKDSLVNQYKESFKLDNHELIFEQDALEEIATIALDRKMGARGLRSIMETILIDLQFSVPDEKDNEGVKIKTITKDFVVERMSAKKGKQVNI